MVTSTLPSETLNGLCSKDRLDLMDCIDSLRSQGINHLVSLPQIIVCGDQSSGKSSVLEALSGVSFPVKGNLCTRFPTEVVLRRTFQVGANVSIVPHHSRSASEKTALAGFQEELEGLEGLAKLVEKAMTAMGVGAHGKAFAKDLLRVEVFGPDRPHLTIVDLPGLIHAQTKNQSASDVGLVQELVQAYMREPRSIILAVVSAKNDFANQVVLKLARSADATGNRTLGIITKPDTLWPKSESESLYVSLARNQEVEFRLGWHVVKNLDSDADSGSLAHRNASELEFFSQGVWKELSESVLGIKQLRSRLSRVLLNHITTELPSLISEIGAKTRACHEELKKLGQARATPYEQQRYLLGVSESFQRLVQSAIDGNWNDPFFGDTNSRDGFPHRIRAVVQNLNDEFAQDLSARGHRRHIVAAGKTPVAVPDHSIAVTRDEFIDHIQEKIHSSRGRELPGLFDPMIVADLFRDQASPWEKLARHHIRATWNACITFLKHAVTCVADQETSIAIMQEIVKPAMNDILAALESKTGELLKAHQVFHCITYNPSFTDTIQSVRKEKENSRVAKTVREIFGVQDLGSTANRAVNFAKVVEALVNANCELGKCRFAGSEAALDYMSAYYKIAMMRFLDDIAVEAIEAVLVSGLPTILSPIKIFEMAPSLVARIAGESGEKQVLRDRLATQVEQLMAADHTCKQFAVAEESVGEKYAESEAIGGRFKAVEEEDVVTNGSSCPSTSETSQMTESGR